MPVTGCIYTQSSSSSGTIVCDFMNISILFTFYANCNHCQRVVSCIGNGNKHCLESFICLFIYLFHFEYLDFMLFYSLRDSDVQRSHLACISQYISVFHPTLWQCGEVKVTPTVSEQLVGLFVGLCGSDPEGSLS